MDSSFNRFKGLNNWASAFVNGEPVLVYVEEATRVYPEGRRERLGPLSVYEDPVKKEQSGEFFDEITGIKYPLYKYTFPDWRVYFERVQVVSRSSSSGLLYLLSLQDEKGNWVPESLRTKEDIEAA